MPLFKNILLTLRFLGSLLVSIPRKHRQNSMSKSPFTFHSVQSVPGFKNLGLTGWTIACYRFPKNQIFPKYTVLSPPWCPADIYQGSFQGHCNLTLSLFVFLTFHFLLLSFVSSSPSSSSFLNLLFDHFPSCKHKLFISISM